MLWIDYDRTVGYEGDQKRQYQIEWVRRRRQAWIEENGPCARCGSSEDPEIDHIDRSTKMMNPRHLWSRRKEVRLAELAKCQVLCRDCHLVKTVAELTQPVADHGTLRRYKGRDKCRCGACRAANSAYEDVRRKRVVDPP